MKKIIATISLIILAFNYTIANNTDSLLVQLDYCLKNRNEYVRLKENSISELKIKLSKENNLVNQYGIIKEIILQYQAYICDSALTYIGKNILIAEKLGNKDYIYETMLKKSFILSLSGLFTESEDILLNMDVKQLKPELLKNYYKTYLRFYSNLLKYTDNGTYINKYKTIIINYRDSLLNILPEESIDYKIETGYNYHDKAEYGKALNILLQCRNYYQPEDHMYAMLSARIAYVYESLNNIDLFKENIIAAAITDTKLAVKENEALLNLAIVLNREGEQKRAYNYIKISMDDANFYNSRFRSSIISRANPIIEKSYLNKIQQQSNNLKLYAILISVLLISLGIASIYIYKQMKTASKAKRNLDSLNNRLSKLNKNLDEANRIKEEYLGYFISQCSKYIDDLDEYKKLINRKVVAGQIDELYKLTSSTRNVEKIINELYKNFDAVFLRLYPTFVSEFNALLKENERYKLKENNLNAELRIFALIRLGISDSNQISAFLRYSVRTIYNYRSRVKSKSFLSGEEFEKRILKIGSFQS